MTNKFRSCLSLGSRRVFGYASTLALAVLCGLTTGARGQPVSETLALAVAEEVVLCYEAKDWSGLSRFFVGHLQESVFCDLLCREQILKNRGESVTYTRRAKPKFEMNLVRAYLLGRYLRASGIPQAREVELAIIINPKGQILHLGVTERPFKMDTL